MKALSLFILFMLLAGCVAAGPGAFQSLNNRVMPIGYAYVQVTGTPNVDPNAWTRLCLSCTAGTYTGYLGTFDVYATPHGSDGQWLIADFNAVPANLGHYVFQSRTAEVGQPIDPSQAFWYRGGVSWDFGVGFQKYLNVPQ